MNFLGSRYTSVMVGTEAENAAKQRHFLSGEAQSSSSSRSVAFPKALLFTAVKKREVDSTVHTGRGALCLNE